MEEDTQRGLAGRRVEPRRLVHTGRQVAAGLLLDARVIGEAEVRARVLAAWTPGTSVSALVSGPVVLLWPEPRPLFAASAPGAILVARDGALTALPLDAHEWDVLAPVPPGALVRARDGVAEVLVGGRSAVDPAQWIDLDGVTALAATTLGAAPQPIEAPSVAREIALRAELLPPGAREADPEAEAVVASLRSAARAAAEDRAAALKAAARGGGVARATARATASASWWSRMRAALARTRSALAAALAMRRAGPAGAAKASSASSAANARQLADGEGAASVRPSWWRRLTDALFGRAPAGAAPPASAGAALRDALVSVEDREPPPRSRLARALQRLANYLTLSRWAGERNARYLTDMLDRFERGDLLEALRHAIPLAGESEHGEASEPAHGAPRPRDNLQISGARSGPGSALFASGDLYAHLRRLYRTAFDRLVREGKIEEAAFVLAELLNESAEAVSFLERHGKARLAAELAEARKLDPALIVRQWMIAGDVTRAIELARRHGVFASAIGRLERTHRELARRFRLLWADLTADAGDYAGAIEIVWPLEDARALASAWLDRAIAIGGDVGARLIARKAYLHPEAYDELAPLVRELCADPDRATARDLLARNLLDVSNDTARRLAHPLLRAVLRDRGVGANGWSVRELRALADHARDAALRVDLPDAGYRPAPDGDLVRFSLLIDPRDVGRTPLYDAARLPNGQLVLACGEGGVRWITRDGRPVAHFDVPAERLVMSDHGDRLLAVASRGAASLVSKVDLRERRAKTWLDLAIAAHADTFDGSVWYVMEAGATVAIDLLSTRLKSLWRVSFDGRPQSIARCGRELAFAVSDDDGCEVWSYTLPEATLRRRQPLLTVGPCMVGANGAAAVIDAVGDLHHSEGPALPSNGRPYAGATVGPAGELLAFRTGSDHLELEVYGNRRLLGQVVLGGRWVPFARVQGTDVIVGDRSGRLLVRSITRSGRLLNLRL